MRTKYGLFCAFGTTAIWSFIPIMGKVALLEASPQTIVFIRLLMATILFFIFMVIFHRDALRDMLLHPSPLFLLGGLALGINLVLMSMGLKITTMTATQLLTQLEIVFFLLWMVFIFNERLSRIKVLGIILALAGVFAIYWNGEDSLLALLSSNLFLGNLMVSAGAFFFSIYLVCQKRLSRSYPSYSILLPTMLVAMISTFFFVPSGEIGTLSINTWGAIIFLGVLGSFVAMFLLGEALHHVDGSTVGIITTLAPIMTILLVGLGILLGLPLFSAERFTIQVLLGGLILVLGVGLVVRDR